MVDIYDFCPMPSPKFNLKKNIETDSRNLAWPPLHSLKRLVNSFESCNQTSDIGGKRDEWVLEVKWSEVKHQA